MKIYRAAIVGCGRIASGFDEDPKRKYISTHAKAYKSYTKTKLVALCDLDESRLGKCQDKWSVPSIYTDHRLMLKKEKIDILSICTPPETHFQILKEAVRYKIKAIFCEKPISLSLEEAERMIQLCKKNRIILQIDHQRRFDQNIQRIKDYIANERLGIIQQASFYYTAGIFNTGSHMFDLLLFLFGKADWIIGSYSNNSSLKPHDPNIDGIIKFKSGLTATFQACDVSKFLIFDLDIIGSLGRMKVLKSGFEYDYYKVKNSDIFSGYRELFRSKLPFVVSSDKNFLLNAVMHLVHCLEHREESISSGEDGKMSLALIKAAILSTQNTVKKVLV